MKKNIQFNDPNAIIQLFGSLLQQYSNTQSENEQEIQKPDLNDSGQVLKQISTQLNDIIENLSKIRTLYRMSLKSTFNLAESCEYTQFTPSKIYRDTSLNEIKFTKHLGKTLQFTKSDLDEYLLKEKSNNQK